MKSMLSKSLRCAGRRQLSSLVTGTNPRVTIMQNMLSLESIMNAKDEASLMAATTAVHEIDPKCLPPSLEGMERYLAATPKSDVSEGYMRNPKYWQNETFWGFWRAEFNRPFFMPFVKAFV